MPWRQFKAPEPERAYAALLTYLPLKNHLTVPRFLWYTLQIQKQLKQVTGVVGYTLRAKILVKTFWTLSVWENEAALQAFVGQQPHSDVMKMLAGRMGATAFQGWTVKGSEIPLRLENELHRLVR
jgi:hypothetical protein